MRSKYAIRASGDTACRTPEQLEDQRATDPSPTSPLIWNDLSYAAHLRMVHTLADSETACPGMNKPAALFFPSDWCTPIPAQIDYERMCS
jgi:hypothetical protein